MPVIRFLLILGMRESQNRTLCIISNSMTFLQKFVSIKRLDNSITTDNRILHSNTMIVNIITIEHLFFNLNLNFRTIFRVNFLEIKKKKIFYTDSKYRISRRYLVFLLAYFSLSFITSQFLILTIIRHKEARIFNN